MSTPPSSSPKLHDLSSAAYTKGIASPGHSQLGLQLQAAEAPTVQEVPRPMAVQPGSPKQPPPVLLQPQVSPQLSSSCSLGYQQALCPNSPSSPLSSTTHEPTCLQSSAHPPATGQQQHQSPKGRRNESPVTGPLSLPEVREDSNHNLAPIPVTIKREPEELDQLYLDDGKYPHMYRCALHLRPARELEEESGCRGAAISLVSGGGDRPSVWLQVQSRCRAVLCCAGPQQQAAWYWFCSSHCRGPSLGITGPTLEAPSLLMKAEQKAACAFRK